VDIVKSIELSVSEMMRLREDGYSNKDIAKMLDISIPTVYRYIGSQGQRVPSVIAHWHEKEVEQPQEEKTQIQIIEQTIAVGGFCFKINQANKTITAMLPNQSEVCFSGDGVDEFVEALKMATQFMTGGA
jgi:predicted transcriptional regulator